ncbi:MAG: Proton/glutamate-aspartate symporter [Chlamydiia bacterium]|nr:Proton/glutamate-aspartate symporter [Chlamydiia bacterium]
MKAWIKILIGLVSGVLFGLIAKEQFAALTVLGKIFIDLLKMLVGIMVFSSIVTGVCHINDPKKLGRIGLRTITFYMLTTLIAISMGVVIGYVFAPGSSLDLMTDASFVSETTRIGILDFVSSIIPANPFAALVEGNIMQVIVFAILFALAVTLCGEKGKPIVEFFESLAAVLNTLTHIIMKLAPYGVFALIASAVGSMGAKVIWPLIQFLLCLYLACSIQLFGVFTFILKFIIKTPVMPFFKGMKDAIVLAFTTSSSAATLPVTMECAKDELGISEDISGFVLSLGSTVNMNGAAIGQAISALFIAQAYGIELTWLKIGVLVFTSLLTAIGAAGIPGQGIVMLSVVLASVGLPVEGIALVAGVDRIREMISCVVNVLGDAVAALYVAKKEGQLNEKKYASATWMT